MSSFWGQRGEEGGREGGERGGEGGRGERRGERRGGREGEGWKDGEGGTEGGGGERGRDVRIPKFQSTCTRVYVYGYKTFSRPLSHCRSHQKRAAHSCR